jgi:hypothetical protein
MARANLGKEIIMEIIMAVEAKIRDASISLAKSLGAKHKRMHFGHGAAAGWPDDLFLFMGGRSAWIEFKAPGKKATPLQAHVHEGMREYGQHVFVCDSIDSAREAFAQVLGADKRSA